MSDYIKQNSSEISFTNSENWVILNPIELSIKKKIEQYEKILKLLNDGEWHKTAEIADNLGLKDTRTKELLKELIALDKPIDNGKTKGKLYKLK